MARKAPSSKLNILIQNMDIWVRSINEPEKKVKDCSFEVNFRDNMNSKELGKQFNKLGQYLSSCTNEMGTLIMGISKEG